MSGRVPSIVFGIELGPKIIQKFEDIKLRNKNLYSYGCIQQKLA